MLKIIKKVERYLTPTNKLFVKDVAQEITADEWKVIPAKDKALFEDVNEANDVKEAEVL